MANKDRENIKNKMASFGDKLKEIEPTMTIQEVKPVQQKIEQPKEEEPEAEKAFHLFIPINLFQAIKKTSVDEMKSMKDYINALLLADMVAKNKLDKEGKPIK